MVHGPSRRRSRRRGAAGRASCALWHLARRRRSGLEVTLAPISVRRSRSRGRDHRRALLARSTPWPSLCSSAMLAGSATDRCRRAAAPPSRAVGGANSRATPGRRRRGAVGRLHVRRPAGRGPARRAAARQRVREAHADPGGGDDADRAGAARARARRDGLGHLRSRTCCRCCRAATRASRRRCSSSCRRASSRCRSARWSSGCGRGTARSAPSSSPRARRPPSSTRASSARRAP